MKSENINFLMNVGYQGLMLAFPLITVPLVSRALGAQNIGIYSYTYSIANMFMLAGMLGISNYGNRSVARVRDDEVALSREFSSTYALQVAVSLVAVGAYALYLVLFPQQYGQVAWIQLIQVLSVCFDVSWLFFGLEKFFLTIVRNLIVKVLSLLLIAVFVKRPDDLWAYTLIMACSTLMSQLYLFCSVPRYVKPVRPELRGSARRLRDIAVLFLPVAAYSVYRVLDKTMLGSLSTVTELGYFENAEKLINIPIAVITALGTVMLPRMSYVLSKSDADYRSIILSSMRLALTLSCAMAMGLIVIADDICPVFFGPGFEGCAPVIRLLAITVICSAWSSVVRTQFLIPKAKDSVYVGSTVGAAAVNLVLNVILIPRFGSLGACAGTIAAELFIVIFQTIATGSDLDARKYFGILFVQGVKSVAISVMALCAASMFDDAFIRLVVEMAVFIVGFFILNGRYIAIDFLGLEKKQAKNSQG